MATARSTTSGKSVVIDILNAPTTVKEQKASIGTFQSSIISKDVLKARVDVIESQTRKIAIEFVDGYNKLRELLDDPKKKAKTMDTLKNVVQGTQKKISEFTRKSKIENGKVVATTASTAYTSYESVVDAFAKLNAFQLEFTMLHGERELQLERLKKEYAEKSDDNASIVKNKLTADEKEKIYEQLNYVKLLASNVQFISMILIDSAGMTNTKNVETMLVEEIEDFMDAVKLESLVTYPDINAFANGDEDNVAHVEQMRHVYEVTLRRHIRDDDNRSPVDIYNSLSTSEKIIELTKSNRLFIENHIIHDKVTDYVAHQMQLYKTNGKFDPSIMHDELQRILSDSDDDDDDDDDDSKSTYKAIASNLEMALDGIVSDGYFEQKFMGEKLNQLPLKLSVDELLHIDLDTSSMTVINHKLLNDDNEDVSRYESDSEEMMEDADFIVDENNDILGDGVSDDSRLLFREAREAIDRIFDLTNKKKNVDDDDDDIDAMDIDLPEIESDEEEESPDEEDAEGLSDATQYAQILALLLRLGFNPVELFKYTHEFEEKALMDVCLPLVDAFHFYPIDKPRPRHATVATMRSIDEAFRHDIPDAQLPPLFFIRRLFESNEIKDEYKMRTLEGPLIESVNITMEKSYVFFCKVVLQLGNYWWNTHNLPPLLNIQDDTVLEQILTMFIKYCILPARRIREREKTVQPMYAFDADQLIEDAEKGTEAAMHAFDILRNTFDTLTECSFSNLAVQLYALHSEDDATMWQKLTERFEVYLKEYTVEKHVQRCEDFLQDHGSPTQNHLDIDVLTTLITEWMTVITVPDSTAKMEAEDMERETIQLHESLLDVSISRQLAFALLLGSFCQDDATKRWAKSLTGDSVASSLTPVIGNMIDCVIDVIQRDALIHLANATLMGESLKKTFGGRLLTAGSLTTPKLISEEGTRILGEDLATIQFEEDTAHIMLQHMIAYPAVRMTSLTDIGSSLECVPSQVTLDHLQSTIYGPIKSRGYETQWCGEFPGWKLPLLLVPAGSLSTLIKAIRTHTYGSNVMPDEEEDDDNVSSVDDIVMTDVNSDDDMNVSSVDDVQPNSTPSNKRKREPLVDDDDEDPESPTKKARVIKTIDLSHERFGQRCDHCQKYQGCLLLVKHNILFCGPVCLTKWNMI